MLTDLLLDPFDAHWPRVRDVARAAEAAGFDGLWTWDHLAGRVHRTRRVLEAWTTLTALAAIVPRVGIGPLVLNVANRDAGTLAVMAATLQEVSGGRLLLGLGAGGGPATPYAAEQLALGRARPAGDAARREELVRAIAGLRHAWADPDGAGFLRPDPEPPVVIGAFGPKMAALAGRHGDGINAPAGHPRLGELVDVARQAHTDAGREASPFLVTAFAGLDDRWLATAQPARLRLERLGVERLVLITDPSVAPAEIDRAGGQLRSSAH